MMRRNEVTLFSQIPFTQSNKLHKCKFLHFLVIKVLGEGGRKYILKYSYGGEVNVWLCSRSKSMVVLKTPLSAILNAKAKYLFDSASIQL